MTATIDPAARYIAAPGEGGTYDVIDTQTGESVGVADSETIGRSVQRLNALLHANAKRTTAADFKKTVKALGKIEGARKLASFLYNPDPLLDGILAYDALMAVPSLGRSKATLLLVSIGVGASASRRVRDLSPRQRRLLAEALAERADRLEAAA